jgi:integrase
MECTMTEGTETVTHPPQSHTPRRGTKLSEPTIARLRLKPHSYFVWDGATTGLGIKVTASGKRIWVLQLIYPGGRCQTKRTLGRYPGMGLAEARSKATEWYAAVKQGIDPAAVEADQRAANEVKRRAEALTRENTFASVAERFIAEHVNGHRRAKKTAGEIRSMLVVAWASRPVAEIMPADVKAVITRIKTRAPFQARQAFTHLTTLFKWCVYHDLLPASPAASLSPKWLFDGVKLEPRQRALDDEELRVFWRATGRMPYPAGPLFRVLALTAVRLNEALQARWSEFSPQLREALHNGTPLSSLPDAAKVWTIPAARFKTDTPHLVPLSDAVLAILETLPRRNGNGNGDFLFTNNGRTPHHNDSAWKVRLDKEMLLTLKALARKHGEDPHSIELTPFKIHDLRRTVRTNLAAAKVNDVVAEAVLGHGRKGIERIYNVHGYLPEIRQALALWAARLVGANQ